MSYKKTEDYWEKSKPILWFFSQAHRARDPSENELPLSRISLELWREWKTKLGLLISLGTSTDLVKSFKWVRYTKLKKLKYTQAALIRIHSGQCIAGARVEKQEWLTMQAIWQ